MSRGGERGDAEGGRPRFQNRKAKKKGSKNSGRTLLEIIIGPYWKRVRKSGGGGVGLGDR